MVTALAFEIAEPEARREKITGELALAACPSGPRPLGFETAGVRSRIVRMRRDQPRRGIASLMCRRSAAHVRQPSCPTTIAPAKRMRNAAQAGSGRREEPLGKRDFNLRRWRKNACGSTVEFSLLTI